jgi:hypothetical protein
VLADLHHHDRWTTTTSPIAKAAQLLEMLFAHAAPSTFFPHPQQMDYRHITTTKAAQLHHTVPLEITFFMLHLQT